MRSLWGTPINQCKLGKMKADHEYPNTTVADENDQNSRYVRYHDALENGWIRRIAEVFVVDRENRKVLLQMRSAKVHISPNTWAASVGEGVDEGEDYEDSARRGLGEELGLPDTELIEVSKAFAESRSSHGDDAIAVRSWSKVFLAAYYCSEISVPEEEISRVDWFTVEQINAMLIDDKTAFSMRFPQTWKNVREKIQDFMDG